MTRNEITITADNLYGVKESLPGDQSRELSIGCRTWGIVYEGGQRGQITIWPNGRGAICFGGDSVWGDWDNVCKWLRTDDGRFFDADGKRLPL